jgi:hypothetical protein
MITAFLITTLVFFSLSLILALLIIGVSVGSEQRVPLANIINIVILLGMITWNIIVLFNV